MDQEISNEIPYNGKIILEIYILFRTTVHTLSSRSACCGGRPSWGGCFSQSLKIKLVQDYNMFLIIRHEKQIDV